MPEISKKSVGSVGTIVFLSRASLHSSLIILEFSKCSDGTNLQKKCPKSLKSAGSVATTAFCGHWTITYQRQMLEKVEGLSVLAFGKWQIYQNGSDRANSTLKNVAKNSKK